MTYTHSLDRGIFFRGFASASSSFPGTRERPLRPPCRAIETNYSQTHKEDNVSATSSPPERSPAAAQECGGSRRVDGGRAAGFHATSRFVTQINRSMVFWLCCSVLDHKLTNTGTTRPAQLRKVTIHVCVVRVALEVLSFDQGFDAALDDLVRSTRMSTNLVSQAGHTSSTHGKQVPWGSGGRSAVGQ